MGKIRTIQAIKACLGDLSHEAYEAGLKEVGMLSATAALAAAEAVGKLQIRLILQHSEEVNHVN